MVSVCSELDGLAGAALPMVWFESAISRLGIALNRDQLDAFDLYARRLVQENPRSGLTSSRTGREMLYRRHFAESLAILAALEIEPPTVDIGSGGGFPGLPIAIARPELPISLVEANGKKARFLESIAAELILSQVTVIQARAEDLGRDPAHRERHGVAFGRAVAPLRILVELALPLVRVGGMLASPKGSSASREVREAGSALETLGGEIESTLPLEVLNVDGPQQTLIVVRKTAPTPERYPRRAGIPAKRPL